MTVSVVQTAIAAGLANTASFGSGVTQGNYLVIVTGAYTNITTLPVNTSSPTLGGTAPAGAAQLLYQGSPNTGDEVAEAIWLLPVTSAIAGQTAISCPWTNSGTSGYTGVAGYETAGWPGTPVLDRSSGSGGDSTAVTSLATPAVRYAPGLAVGAMVGYGQLQGSPSGWTNVDASGGDQYFRAGYQIIASAGGTYAYAATAGSAANWAAGIITLGVASSFTAAPGRPRSQAVSRASVY